MRDTLDSLGVKEPMLLGNFGSIFWARSYTTGEEPSSRDTLEDFLKFYNQKWVQHYALPYGGNFTLSLFLDRPLRNDGFESVVFYIDWIMSTLEWEFNSERGKVPLEKLTIPKELILCLRNLLFEFEGDELLCLYCWEDDPREIWFEFVGCRELTLEPDELLGYIAKQFRLALLCPNLMRVPPDFLQ